MKKAFTIEQIKERFLVKYSIEDKRDIADRIRNNMEQRDAAEMLTAIIEATEAHGKQYPSEAAAMEEWTPIDRLLWNIKEAFVLGVIDGLEKAALANEGIIEDMERGIRTEREELAEIIKQRPEIAAELLEKAKALLEAKQI